MKTETPRDLFFDQLQDLYSVESQLKVSLPTLAMRADDTRLANLMKHHYSETCRQFDVVERIITHYGYSPGGDTCQAMEGLITGGDQHLDTVEIPTTRDLMLIAHCLRIEHYEMAAYTITASLARQLGFEEEAIALETILQEEHQAAVNLSRLQPMLFHLATRVMVDG